MYDTDYKELIYSAITPTETSSKLIIVKPRSRYHAVEEYPEGWNYQQDITVYTKSNVQLEARSGPDADIITVTESGHYLENQVFRVVSSEQRSVLGITQTKYFLKALSRDDGY